MIKKLIAWLLVILTEIFKQKLTPIPVKVKKIEFPMEFPFESN
jgi:hypothetical protein